MGAWQLALRLIYVLHCVLCYLFRFELIFLMFYIFAFWIYMQEIVSIYPALSPPTLSPGASNRVCNALLQVCLCINEGIVAQFIGIWRWLLLLWRAHISFTNNMSDFSWCFQLLQCVASHHETRILFLNGNMPCSLHN
jgi:hypothetical protein